MAGPKGSGPYEGTGGTYKDACDDAHKKASQDGHGENDWLAVSEVHVRGNNPMTEYLVKLRPGG